jgi:hypothetical protein
MVASQVPVVAVGREHNCITAEIATIGTTGDFPRTDVEVSAAALWVGIHHVIFQRSTDRSTASKESRHDPLPLPLFDVSTCLHRPLLVYGSTCQVIVGQVGGLDQMVLQLDGEPLVEHVSFLLFPADMLGPILGEGVELASVVIHSVVP